MRSVGDLLAPGILRRVSRVVHRGDSYSVQSNENAVVITLNGFSVGIPMRSLERVVRDENYKELDSMVEICVRHIYLKAEKELAKASATMIHLKQTYFGALASRRRRFRTKQRSIMFWKR